MFSSDLSLVLSVQKGKHSAFERLYQQYLPKIYSFLMIKTGGNIPLSQDITSETFVKAFEKIHTFDTEKKGSFSAWLYKIAYNSFIDAIKQKNNADQQINDTCDYEEAPDFADILAKKEFTKEVLAFLNTL